jgi:glucan-binding YG repeat protein
MKTGWLLLDGTWYWLDQTTGAMQAGWQSIGGSRYFFDATTGAMHTGWALDGTTWYYLNPDTGAMQTGWLNLGGTWYWLTDSGAMATGWQNIGGTWYYFDAGSGAMHTGWLLDGTAWYWLNGSGAMQTGWINLSGTWYYLYGSGVMAKGWAYVNGSWYWLDQTTVAMQTGWLSLDGTWYWLTGSGAMATGWVKVGGIWYYFYGSGAMATGWMQLGSDWYYLDDSGAMCTGYFKVGDWWYYAYSSGVVMYEDVTWDSVWGEYVIVGSDWHAHTYTGTVLDIPWYINQYAGGAPEGCEGASLLMALWSKGYCLDMSYKQFLKTMPYATDGNPYHGFVGTPYANDGNFDTIMMPAAAKCRVWPYARHHRLQRLRHALPAFLGPSCHCLDLLQVLSLDEAHLLVGQLQDKQPCHAAPRLQFQDQHLLCCGSLHRRHGVDLLEYLHEQLDCPQRRRGCLVAKKTAATTAGPLS